MEKRILRKEYRVMGLPLWDSLRTEVVLKKLVLGTEEHPDQAPEFIEEGKPAYIVGSWFLKDCHTYLCGKPVEDMHYVSGLRFKNFLTLERLTKFELSSQSVCLVKGELSSSFRSLMDIEGHGYCLTAWFHSHPGRGKESVFVSPTDKRTQRTLEAGQYQAIGAVFSQDGYIRFFSDNLEFTLMVLGKGVEQIDENVYRISQD